MPKATFYNLDEEKKQNITNVLISEFSQKPYSEVNVKTIVERLGIARGSFYQYFNNLEDSYFYILDNKTYDIHILFMTTLKNNKGDVSKSLEEFGNDIAEIIFRKEVYKLYKNRYLYWDESLNANWEHTHKDFKNAFNEALNMGVDEEKIFFFRAVVHSLIERNYREEWDRETFLEKYRIHIEWIKGGIFNEIR
ncbi:MULTISPECIES: TetR/AcrR family transcriptional regulator [Anaerococcus]|uniref:Bacterial regulatory proteins, tetR family n=1 Tax=Anaerococcus octavius TaxID=54007 RepID=A0A2I1M8H0_9FIRM|nr:MULTISPECIES: TetR/AcrR family transcriptional regulator [Anaerococcus]MBS6106015.1 TetR/AcrR family transcriptional regulator [Anaerococcus sp.]MDU3177555.1 TetR/AcrR family transcriptional regulator [Anaerococcus sp.]MDU4025954.1 TetR/AcrR family transcriptional regulator [Anaerococcus sp.]PKZ16424.1 TetR/AcrR family transcriptional regulator [Anaerococcus octavius]SUU92535.1 Bacterial regulatory proteins, tetR family [Anaerococcus octavius]